ncbi:putative NBD/HSP70 family sugar kinase [Microbacterium ginsengiterrae]|uniref:Putative NBD/HSP70 family sugar kinase n=1 Tax=Microbacterium ginsengiterrae TaxID=546115 RepID=A0A7W9FDH8_9MICO|nr:ROK family transcriptional regulator [Microbacterium ginsengiterrae]MBB5743533.1 putative NBD/HSP70 family sugar kinase [Microbacterium ginsengiterrae]
MKERATAVEAVRRTNLGEVLRLVHHEGTRSRSLITAETGLNRSTVADLVTALVERGLVVEQEPDPTKRVGRPSPSVSANADVIAIGANPEVDAIEIGAVSLGGGLRARARIERDGVPSVADAVATIADTVAQWREDELAGCRLIGVGVAVPGLVRAADGLVRLAPHLNWRDEDIASPLADALDMPVAVDNDASLGARAEHLFGAARDHADIVYLNGGASGIGGGLILDGSLIRGAGGYAGEWGQTRPGIPNDAYRRTHDGVLEDEVSRARLLAAAKLTGGDDAALAAALAAEPGPTAEEEVARQRHVLAATISNAVNALNPSMIVLGGFLGILRDRDPESFDADVRARSLAVAADEVQIASAALGRDRLLIGAAEASFAALLADPLG